MFSCDCLSVPLKNDLVDAAISIAVIHHLANEVNIKNNGSCAEKKFPLFSARLSLLRLRIHSSQRSCRCAALAQILLAPNLNRSSF